MDPEEKIQEMEKELSELRPLKDSSVKLQEEFKQKEEAWLNEKKDLEESANPNWQKARKKIDVMSKVLSDKGIQIDEDGNILNQHQVDVDKIQREASEKGAQAARSELLNNKLEELLSPYDSSSAQLVKHFYNKVTTGETVTLSTIEKFVKMAHSAAEVETGNQIKKSINFSGGQGPRFQEQGQIDETRRNELGSLMGLTFSKIKK